MNISCETAPVIFFAVPEPWGWVPLRRDGVPMTSATEQILQAALALPEQERLELTEALLASEGHTSGLPFDPAWLVEIRRRSAEVESGSIPLTPWPVVRERVRRRLEGRSSG